jgi:hypothetical protein
MRPARFLTVLSIAATVLVALTLIGCWALWTQQHRDVDWVMLAQALIYATVAWFVLRHEGVTDRWTSQRALLLILGTASLMRVLLIFPPPVSTDVYRYVWDGRVQAAGTNPYRHRPADPELAFLRDQVIYPNINRAATAPTIYPPMAQAIFVTVTRIAETVTAIKAAMVGFEIAAIWTLLALLRRHDLPETRVLLYAWHPLPLFEFAGSGHIDAAAIALMLIACLATDRRQPAIAGVMLTSAALVKYFPAVIAPALYRRWDWRFPVAAIAAAIILYLPYIGVGWRVLGFLPGYAQEEALTAGSGFFLLAAIGTLVPLPQWAPLAYMLMGFAVLAAIALFAIFRCAPEAVAVASAMLLLGVFTVFLSPHLAWYFTWIIPFLCFRPSPALIYLSGAAPLLYRMIWDPGELRLNAALYVPFALLLSFEIFAGQRRSAMEVLDDGKRLPNRRAG